MSKLLTVCIPTYKRPDTLRPCIDSIVFQIEKYALKDFVDIYVANDASPDDTESVLDDYDALNYFKGISRENNLGMNLNIKTMLFEIARTSDYQLIITDDDYLQPDMLDEIVKFLRLQQNDSNRVAAIWTPRYSYTEDGNLFNVACNPFKESCRVLPSIANAAKYMKNGFVLSGLILRAECIDFEFWEQKYSENAYFPMIFFGDLLLGSGAYYWEKNIVHHTVLNQCHWESWGKNDVVIMLRKFTDAVNTYGILSGRIDGRLQTAGFYFSVFSKVFDQSRKLLLSNEMQLEKSLVEDAFKELKEKGILNYYFQLRLMMACSAPLIILGALKDLFMLQVSHWLRGKKNNERYIKIQQAQTGLLRAMPVLFKLIIS